MASFAPSASPSAGAGPYPGRAVALVGMMGAGKSSVGRRLAARFGTELLDSDAQVEAMTGRTVPEIWASDGEAGFRPVEAKVLADAFAGDRWPSPVVAAAGGVVLDPVNRELLRRFAHVVWLRAQPTTLARRVGTGEGRPLLAHDPAGTLVRLEGERRPYYEEVADVVIDVDDRSVDEVTAEIVRRLAEGIPTVVPVNVGDRSYGVHVGPGVLDPLPVELSALEPAPSRAVIVTQPGIKVDVEPGVPHDTVLMAPGEQAKSLATVEQLCRHFAEFGLTRTDVVIAVGGGVVTDTAGFAAAAYHRGVRVVHVPTTLLGQVDAAIGGKTGVNLPEGKNLVGAFWQPSLVVCDIDVLATLPEREYRSGLGEVAKYHFLPGGAHIGDMFLSDQVATCVAIKAAFVSADEREAVGGTGSGGRGRALLNYGHTLAHALETAGNYDLRHGEAVAIGLVFAARLAHRLGRIDASRIDDHVQAVEAYGLASTLPEGLDVEQVLTLMARDKKAVDGYTFVLDGPSGVEVVRGVSRQDLNATLAEMGGG